ncbi:hypothetical protein EC988_002253, partial [Linderina pennispora]
MDDTVFEIRFPTFTSGGLPKCGPKSTLPGVVYMQLTQPYPATAIAITFTGTERITLAPTSLTVNINPAYPHMTRQQSVKKVYFNQTAVLWGDPKFRQTSTLQPGIYAFHFSCEFGRVNYPMSKVADEYEIKYTLSARIIGSHGVRDPLQTTTHNVIFVPETISPFDTVDPNARYKFCDNALDHSGSWVYHLQAMGIQQAFAPGDSVDFQLRLTGNRTLRKAQYVLVEQTDCFYPQLPSDPSEELMDLGRRLWSTERLLSTASDMYFGRDSVV